ncbi:DDE_4 domain-containing protein [Gossypium australe]|uniref:DDE_4 domain-containing protein n=1 Tax=Gossypium australe TaxID=47621 RepID=A0A5B6WLR7_9ROSI|nr:DDE_4 domain-containing protein [Gossypium australe]
MWLSTTTSEEFFNMKHVSTRNIIERVIFIPFEYKFKLSLHVTCYTIIFAKEMFYNPLECDYEASSSEEVEDVYTHKAVVSGIEPINEWSMFRQQLATKMFSEWRASRSER